MVEDRQAVSREDFARAVRGSENSTRSLHDHHPHGGYTPTAFRHYIGVPDFFLASAAP